MPKRTMSSNATITMKLLIDGSKNKVLFAEGGKDCVDFLLHILSLPLGTVVQYLSKSSMSGSIGNLYGSFERLSIDYLKEGLNKECLLSPKPAAGPSPNVPLLTNNNQPLPDDLRDKKFYTCIQEDDDYGRRGSIHRYVSVTQGGECPGCKGGMYDELVFVVNPKVDVEKKAQRSVDGYVKGVVTYMIMDDLCVEPMSMVSSIALLNRFSVHDVGSLEEKEVTLDMNMALALMKASLMSKTVLTDVFLGKNGADMN